MTLQAARCSRLGGVWQRRADRGERPPSNPISTQVTAQPGFGVANRNGPRPSEIRVVGRNVYPYMQAAPDRHCYKIVSGQGLPFTTPILAPAMLIEEREMHGTNTVERARARSS